MTVQEEKILRTLEILRSYPESFLQKASIVLSFHIPFIDENLKRNDSAVLQLIIDFLHAQDQVKRWLRREEKKDGSIIYIPQKRDKEDLVETDLDHMIRMLQLAQELLNPALSPELAKLVKRGAVFNSIFIHDGGEIGSVGDVTHVDEALWIASHDKQKSAEYKNLINFWASKKLVNKKQRQIIDELMKQYFAEEYHLTNEGNIVKFLDRLQAVIFGINHIYPYEQKYQNTKNIKEYISKYAIEQLFQAIQDLNQKAQDELLRFTKNHLTINIVSLSYEKAIESGNLEKAQGEELASSVISILDLLHGAPNAQTFTKDWSKLRSTDEFFYIKKIEAL